MLSILLQILSNTKAMKEHNEVLQKNSFQAGIRAENERQQKQRKDIYIIEAESFLGKPIFTLSNEWNNPLVGEVISLYTEKGSPLYTIKDYISGTECSTLTKPFEFSMQKLQMIGKLTPDEICCLFYEGRSKHGTFRKHHYYGNKNACKHTNYDDWMQKITQNGFFEKFGQFLDEEEKQSEQHWQELTQRFGPC